MPEGNVIHRLARDHGRLLVGERIHVSSPQGRFSAGAARLDGAVLEGVEAFGKHLFYSWDTGEIGHVHLGLVGKFRLRRQDDGSVTQGASAPSAVRMRMRTGDVTIDLSGPMSCTVGPPSDRDAIVRGLGPDPLRRDARPEMAIERIRRSGRAIADLLLDQSVISGLGNIYRAEVLFVCGIHPMRPGRGCSTDEVEQVWSTARRMMRAGVAANRIVTVRREELGLPRGAPIPRDEAWYAYKRDRCIRCGDAIRAIRLGGRPCFYCPTDQPA